MYLSVRYLFISFVYAHLYKLIYSYILLQIYYFSLSANEICPRGKILGYGLG